MKTVTLVRHAKSSWKRPELSDYERPLNKRGKSDAPLMGKILHTKGISPDYFVSSSAKRAFSTSKRIAKKIGYPVDDIIQEKNLYHAEAEELLALVRELKSGVNHLLLCGHNPGLTDLCNMLVNDHIDNIPTCGIASISFDIDSWEKVNEQTGTLLYYDYPKKHYKE